MDKTIVLTEAVKAPVKKKGNRWLVTVATPGQGSSGFYSEELLREQGPRALHAGAQSFVTHDPSRNPKDMIGVFPEGGFWNEEKGVLQAELEVHPHWVDFVEAVGPHCGMSLYMHGKTDEDGNVIELTPNQYNGCDLVSRPGLSGSGLDGKLYEALRAEAHAEADEDGHKEEIEKKVEALSDMLAQFVASQEKVKEEDEVTPEQLVAEALNAYHEAIAEIDKAELLPSQVEDLRERAKKGEEVTPLIESAKKINAELKAQFEEAAKSDSGVGNVRTLQVEDARELGKVFG